MDARVKTVSAAAIALALAFAAGRARAQSPGDDWQEVGHQTIESAAPAPSSSSSSSSASAGEGRRVVNACGERAYAAGEPYRTIMANLNELWGTHARIYESVKVSGPHARPGGCIFFNRRFLRILTRRWMGIDDPDQLTEILYAIAAHELGHLMHGDLTPARAGVPMETRELEADRFAGYSLWRLNIHFDADETANYYKLVGDDFVGGYDDHGTGVQRVAAFKEGWDLARMGLPEESEAAPVGGLGSDESRVPPGQYEAP
jgi:hypothetical protein